MNSHDLSADQDPATLLVLLGPSAMNKKKWMRFIVGSFPEIFHIVRIFTTKPPETWEERPFYAYTPEKEFKNWRDLGMDEFFWGTYERHEGENMFLY